MNHPEEIRIQFQDEMPRNAKIKVIGVGGGGGNAVNRMIQARVEGVEFIAANTDVQAFSSARRRSSSSSASNSPAGSARAQTPTSAAAPPSKTPTRSSKPSKGLTWSSSLPDSAAAPAPAPPRSSPRSPARWARSRSQSLPALSLSRAKRRMKQAEKGMAELLESVDTMIVIPNEKLLAVAKDAGFFESFRIADDVLRQGVQGISDIITIPGIINRDFADVKTTMAGMGYAVMGTGVRGGSNRAIEAAMAAMASPLLEDGAIDGARGILINISGSSNLKLSEVNEASTLIQNAAHEDANIIFGAVLDENMGDDVKITVIATGFRGEPKEQPERRERLLNTVLNVHVPPVAFVRADAAGVAPRFASEAKEEITPVPFKSAEPRVSPAVVYAAASPRVEDSRGLIWLQRRSMVPSLSRWKSMHPRCLNTRRSPPNTRRWKNSPSWSLPAGTSVSFRESSAWRRTKMTQRTSMSLLLCVTEACNRAQIVTIEEALHPSMASAKRDFLSAKWQA